MVLSYWDSTYDDELLKNPIGTKLVYNQFRDDHKRYWIQPNEQQLLSLKRLIEQDKQHEVIFLTHFLKYVINLHVLLFVIR